MLIQVLICLYGLGRQAGDAEVFAVEKVRLRGWRGEPWERRWSDSQWGTPGLRDWDKLTAFPL